MKTLRYGLAAIVAGSMLAQPQAGAHEDDGGRWQGLGGVWMVKLAPRNCATGAALPVPSLQTIFTFHGDGTLSASLQNYAQTATNRSLSHGLWRHAGDRGEYAIRFTHLRFDFATGVYLGTQEAASQLHLDRASDTFTAESTTKGVDANGNQVYTNCATLTGERLPQP